MKIKNTLVIGGDLFPTPCNLHLFETADINSLFLGSRNDCPNIVEIIKNASFSIFNLEGCLTENTDEIIKSSGPKLKASPKSISAIKALGVSCLATANNHVMDFLSKGYHDTINTIKEYGIDYVGSGSDLLSIKKSITVTINDYSICIYNVAETMYNVPTVEYPGVNIYDEFLVCKDLIELRKKHDYIIVVYHGGTEFFPYPTPMLKKRFHRMADCGADLITAQHTHCLGCEEYYNGSYLLYGQGNFLFNRHKGHLGDALLLELDFSKENKPALIKHHLIHNTIGVEYDCNQDMNGFMKRNTMIYDDCFLYKKFQEFALSLYPNVSKSFQSINLFDRFLYKVLPQSLYVNYRKKYRFRLPNMSQTLRLLYTLESEQQRETATAMLRAILCDYDKYKYNDYEKI